jgi:hypothetical protein
MVSCPAYSSNLNMDVICSSETSVDFRRAAPRCIRGVGTLQLVYLFFICFLLSHCLRCNATGLVCSTEKVCKHQLILQRYHVIVNAVLRQITVHIWSCTTHMQYSSRIKLFFLFPYPPDVIFLSILYPTKLLVYNSSYTQSIIYI